MVKWSQLCQWGGTSTRLDNGRETYNYRVLQILLLESLPLLPLS